jgi:hypothetical protein
MDMKKNEPEADNVQIAASLAPLEEQGERTGASQPGSAKNIVSSDSGFAAIVVDADDVNLSQDIMQRPPEKTFLGMEPVVLFILGFMLAFIAFIAWQISQMPPE